MATRPTSKAKANTNLAGVNIPECPVCLEVMTAPIYQCNSGHSLCHSCTTKLVPPKCPICRELMTQMRNWQLEDLINKAQVRCPNHEAGCKYTMPRNEIDYHVQECIFRNLDCPLNVLGKCSWNGKRNQLMDHFKERHPSNCNLKIGEDITLTNISTEEDNRWVYLVSNSNMLFILTMKVDTLLKSVFWVVQLIGTKKVSREHLYVINVISKHDPLRKTIFIDHCYNDTFKINDVFQQAKCATMPFNAFSNFVQNKSLILRLEIERHPSGPFKKHDKNLNENKKEQVFKKNYSNPQLKRNNKAPKTPAPYDVLTKHV